MVRGHLVEVVELVGRLELLELEEVGAEGIDERVEGHAVLPRGVHGGKVVSRKVVRWQGGSVALLSLPATRCGSW